MDTLVFDIETQNFFTDPGVGWDNFAALKISVVGVYSYGRDQYFTFEENEMEKLAELFAGARRIIGFSMNRYDVPVLNNYFQKLARKNGSKKIASGTLNLWEKERIDLLEEIELIMRQKISLSRLAEANLGIKKDRKGSEAITLYREGKMDELKEYCLKDVRLTKELYDLSRKQNFLMVPNHKTGGEMKVEFAKAAPISTTTISALL
jgi:DEAD/DEAH box helicase domain-containing protein